MISRTFPAGALSVWIGILCGLLAATPPSEGETVHLQNGNFQSGEIVSQSEKGITFSFTRDGGGKSKVEIPWEAIERIEFSLSAEEAAALGDPASAQLELLASIWDEQAPWIGREASPAAEIGLAYAERLADSGRERDLEKALGIFDIVAGEAWEPARQAKALRRKLMVLLRAGREKEALREAEAIADASDNPALLLESKMMLSGNYFEKLMEIEEENPRWFLDDEVRPERDRLFHSAVDHALYPYLFYGSLEDAAARGLIRAARIYEYAGDTLNSRRCAEDILKLYPKTELASEAKEHLSKLSQTDTE